MIYLISPINLDERQYYLDAHVAYRRACLQAIAYFKKFGYTGEQIYLLLGAVPVKVEVAALWISLMLVARSQFPPLFLNAISCQPDQTESYATLRISMRYMRHV
jgi:acetamidase/formamidase